MADKCWAKRFPITNCRHIVMSITLKSCRQCSFVNGPPQDLFTLNDFSPTSTGGPSTGTILPYSPSGPHLPRRSHSYHPQMTDYNPQPVRCSPQRWADCTVGNTDLYQSSYYLNYSEQWCAVYSTRPTGDTVNRKFKGAYVIYKEVCG